MYTIYNKFQLITIANPRRILGLVDGTNAEKMLTPICGTSTENRDFARNLPIGAVEAMAIDTAPGKNVSENANQQFS